MKQNVIYSSKKHLNENYLGMICHLLTKNLKWLFEKKIQTKL